MDPSVIDILANGYIEHVGWGDGWNFGTSFATPRVAAEITNLWIDFLNEVNLKLESGDVTLDDLASGETVDYTSYVDSILSDLSSNVYVELDGYGWREDPIAVLKDDVLLTPSPLQVSQTDVGMSQYKVTDSSYIAKLETYDASFELANNEYLHNSNIKFYNGTVDTGKSVLVKNGGAKFSEDVSFSCVRFDTDNLYDFDITLDDVISSLKHVAGLSVLSGTQLNSADVNNDSFVDLDDTISSLKHVAGLSFIDSFDIVDSNYNLITEVSSNQLVKNNWSLVANGDINNSGSFDDLYSLQVDII
jgi:hypothetical protein